MTTPQHPSPDGFGSIRGDEILPLREVARRLGWGQRLIVKAQVDGLRVVQYGRMKYCLGADVLHFFRQRVAGAIPQTDPKN